MSAPISEHLAETSFLIRSNDGGWFQVYVEVRVYRVIPEVIFFKHRIFELVASLFNILPRYVSQIHVQKSVHDAGVYIDFGVINLERVHIVIILVDFI